MFAQVLNMAWSFFVIHSHSQHVKYSSLVNVAVTLSLMLS